jgi:hypothetical protein
MYLGDPKEVEEVLAFFYEHLGKELEIALCVFDGFTETEPMHVAEVTTAEPTRVILQSSQSQRQLHINPHHYSFATVSPDGKKLEIGRLLGSGVTLRLTASEIG